MPLYPYNVDQPPDLYANRVVFFDDFIGYLYDNTTWFVDGTGGSAALQDLNGGRIRVRSTNNNTYRLSLGALGNFLVSKNIELEWYGTLVPGTGTSICECGMESAANPSTDWFAWYRRAGTTNFGCFGGAGGTTFDLSSGVAADSNLHRFKIIASTGFIQFFLDDVIRVVRTTNITADLVRPYTWSTSSSGGGASDATMDYVLALGDN